MEEVDPTQFMHLGLDAWKVLDKSLGRYALRRLGKHCTGEAVDPTLHIKPSSAVQSTSTTCRQAATARDSLVPYSCFQNPRREPRLTGLGGNPNLAATTGQAYKRPQLRANAALSKLGYYTPQLRVIYISIDECRCC